MESSRKKTSSPAASFASSGDLRSRMLAWSGDQVASRPATILMTAAVLGILGALLAGFRLDIDADTNSLISDDRPFMREYRSFIEEFGDLEYIYVVVDAGAPADHEAARAAVDALIEGLEANPSIPEIHGRISPVEQWRLAPRAMDDHEQEALLYASEAFGALASEVSVNELLVEAESGLDGLLRATGGILQDDEGRLARRLGSASMFILETIAAAPPTNGDAWSDFEFARSRPFEYLTSSTGRMYFVEIMPAKDYGSLSVIEQPLSEIRRVVESVRSRHPTIEIGVTGKPVLQADEMATTERDMTRASLLALVVITTLFMMVFRGVLAPLLIVLAFCTAFGWTYGGATLLVGRLNLLSMVFMLVLVGVGLDYGVHVLFRWNEVRGRVGAVDAVREVMRTAVRGNITGALTSAGVFLLALSTNFQGLRELGLIAGIGLLFCMVAMTLVLPALLLLSDGGRAVTGGQSPPGREHRGPRRRRSWSLPWILVVASISVCFVFIVPERLHYETNLLKLQATGLESVEWEHRLFEDDASASWFGVVITDSVEAIPGVLETAGEQPAIGRARSVLDLVRMPDPIRSDRLRSLHESIPSGVVARSPDPTPIETSRIERLSARLEALADLAETGLMQEESTRIREISNRLRAQAEVLRGGDHSSAAALQERIRLAAARTGHALRSMAEGANGSLRSALPEALRARYVSPGGRFIVKLEPNGDIWSQDPLHDFVAAMRDVDEHATGVPVTQYESMRDMTDSFLVMAAGSIAMILVLVWLDFGSLRITLICLGTTVLGMLWTMGVLALCSISINLANFFAIPILIGLGIDGAIHVVHRWRECPQAEDGYGSTLRAISLTAISTAIGFGMLLTARHQGLASLGWVMLIGSLCSLAVTVLVLPVVLGLLGNGKGSTS